jgi:hypothetical protein
MTACRATEIKRDDAYDVELRLVGIDRRDVQLPIAVYVRATSRVNLLAGAADTNSEPIHTRIDNVVTFEFG